MSKIIEETLNKVEEMINDDRQALLGKCKQLLLSGGVDVDAHNPEEYRLAKIVYAAALNDLIENRKPLDPQMKTDIKNLAHF